MANFTTGSMVGKRQDLSKIVADITPNDVPFLKSLGNEKAINTLFNWVDKDVAVPVKAAVAEGATAADTDTNLGRTERTNYTEIFHQVVEVSSSADSVEQAGSATYAERVADKVRMISQQKETAYLSGQVASGVQADRRTASAQAQIDASLVTAGAGAAITKVMVDDILELAWNAGADVDTVYCPSDIKRALTTVLTFAPVTREAGQGKVVTDAVDVYQSDFGDINIMADRYMNAGDVLFADSSMWSEKTLTPMSVEELAKTGLSKRKQVFTEVGLKHHNFKGSALITNIIA